MVSSFRLVAGSGVAGFAGDGAPALQAQFNNPYNMAADGDGNLYVADKDNNRIRRIHRDGIVSTFAGNGVAAFRGDLGPATAASLACQRCSCLA